MSVFRHASDALLCAALLWAGGARAEAARVVSVNLCTDQLLLAVAEPGQIAAVTPMATDDAAAPYAETAKGLLSVPARAEAVFLLEPDLVVAGTFTSRATVDMMRRVGLRVEEFPPATSLEEVAANLRRMGELVGQDVRAEALAEMIEGSVDITADPRSLAALYGANGWLQGRASLAGEIVDRAGFDNVATRTGLDFGGFLSLEELVMSKPDLVILAEANPATSRGDALLDHPALAAAGPSAELIDRDWTCGTPAVMDAIARLADTRRQMEAAR